MTCRLAYLFERFPAFTQTFCAREVAELYRQGWRAPVFSIRRPREPAPERVSLEGIPVTYFPDTNSLDFKLRTKLIAPWRRRVWRSDRDEAKQPTPRDKNRFYEACYLAPRLRRLGVAHVHAHFAGLAARTAWWLHRLYGITYSFTGHARDIFVDKPEERLSLADLVADARFVITETNYSAQILAARCGHSEKVHRVYNGLALDPFLAPQSIPGPPVLLAVGRLIEKKGFRFLLEACRLLQKDGFPLRAVIVGAGPDEAAMQQWIGDWGLRDVVQLLGARTQTEIVRLLSTASMFVFPAIEDRSGDTDNLPTVILEAMASGLPVISTRVAGIPEVVQDGRNGLLVEQKSAEQLAAAVRRLLVAPDLRHQFGAAGRQIVEENFAVDRTVRQLRQYFARYLGA